MAHLSTHARWHTHKRKHQPTQQEQHEQHKAALLEQCQKGQHQLTKTFRPGEQVCLGCGLVLYCPTCLKDSGLDPISMRAVPRECATHQGVQA